MGECLFCRIAAKEAPAYVVLEDDRHIAFLDIFPLVEGQTVVAPKNHRGGYAFDMPEEDLKGLFAFTQRVAKKLDRSLGAERCMQVLQGYTVDHAHTKLFPVFERKGSAVEEAVYRQLAELLKTGWYSGVLISMTGRERESDERLRALSERINRPV